MGAELAIDVDVMISDELREMMRLRRKASASVDIDTPKPSEMDHGMEGRGLPVPPPTEPPQPLPEWQAHCLRQDGARPLTFRGLQLFESRVRVEDLPGTAELTLSLYLSEGPCVQVGLSVLPPEGLAARPIHRAATVNDGDSLTRLLRDFAPETCLETAFISDEETRAQHAIARSTLRAAFTSMAAGCLNRAILPA